MNEETLVETAVHSQDYYIHKENKLNQSLESSNLQIVLPWADSWHTAGDTLWVPKKLLKSHHCEHYHKNKD